MAANTIPIFVKEPNIGQARVTAANTAGDGSGSLTTLFTPGANGSLLFKIEARNSQATAAPSSAMVSRFFLTDNAGSNPRLILELLIAATTRSNTVAGAYSFKEYPNGLFIASGQLLKVIQSIYAGVQDQMDYHAFGGNY